MNKERQHTSVGARLLCVLAAVSITFLAGCTSKFGDRKLNSRYVYESGNRVTVGRNVAASAEHTKFGINCGFTQEEYNAVYDEALEQDPSANVLLNYTTAYEITTLPILVCFNKLTIKGLAATVEVR